MSDPKDFAASMDSDSRRTPMRVAFVTRRTSPQVRARDDKYVMTYPEVLLRAAIAVEAVLLALVHCCRCSGTRRSKGWPIRCRRRIRPRLPGTSSAFRSFCIISRRWSEAF